MNQVGLVGEVTDRPFRPGNGNRIVVKIKVSRGGGNADRFEFDAFGPAGDFASKLFVGDLIAVTGRLEDRSYLDHGEQVYELRIVAQFVELLTKSSERRSSPLQREDHRPDDHRRDEGADDPDESDDADAGR